ncbi:hypothetical protein [Salegentibacter chungangensis]|uniref:Uncharacterized protein n=1 Tax=Salegentibacter chungangensis TaxID=1335724 RepID=A0ABW3NVD2_9FLAO
MKIQHRIALISLAGLMVAGFVYSQIYIHQRSRQELEEIAQELALTWKDKLALTAVQTELLENVIIEYTIRKNEIINSPINEDSMVRKLQAVQRSEHKALKKFLSEEQFEDYTQLNKEITQKA